MHTLCFIRSNTLLVPGSTLLTVTGEIRVQILPGDIFFFHNFFFLWRENIILFFHDHLKEKPVDLFSHFFAKKQQKKTFHNHILGL